VTADGSQYVCRSGENVFVVGSDDFIAERLEELCALKVRGNLLLVVFAVDLDDQPFCTADEVDNVAAG
jgi:hypothetical protein